MYSEAALRALPAHRTGVGVNPKHRAYLSHCSTNEQRNIGDRFSESPDNNRRMQNYGGKEVGVVHLAMEKVELNAGSKEQPLEPTCRD